MSEKKQPYNPKPDYKGVSSLPPCFKCKKKRCNYRRCVEYRVWFNAEWSAMRERFRQYRQRSE